MDVPNQRLVPYPKRLKTLIQDYQKQKNGKDLEKILELIDRLIIKIIQRIYKFESYSFLRNYESNEIYHEAIIAMEKVVCKIKVDENFSIKKLSSYLNGYIGRQFQISFSKNAWHLDIEAAENHSGIKPEWDIVPRVEQENSDENLDLDIPGFPKEAIEILRKHIIHDMSLQEIADEMGQTKGHVRYWVDKGKKILKKVITKERKSHLWHL